MNLEFVLRRVVGCPSWGPRRFEVGGDGIEPGKGQPTNQPISQSINLDKTNEE